MNAVDMLLAHHRRMEDLLGRLVEASGDEKRRLFEETADMLVAHITIEEQHFYPAVKARRTEDVLLESLEEHLSLKRILADLVQLSPQDDRFDPKLHVLKEQAEHHHEEEEEHLFPKARKLLDTEALDALGAEMAATMREIAQKNPRCGVLGQTDEAAPLP
ncbi:MAG TPA: hemerythrin domain-containing protein [Candidatus Nanopelagicales bacterium]|nr:hemerythrin domain-containing protein [Candidatus Nanopelagicales bacterium]